MTAPDVTRRDVSPSRTREALVIASLLSGASTAEAGKVAGLSKRTVERMRHTQTFKVAFSQARSELLTATVDKLRQIGTDAVTVLHRIAMNETARGSDRVLAARHAVDLLLRGVDVAEFSERIAALEAIANSGDKK